MKKHFKEVIQIAYDDAEEYSDGSEGCYYGVIFQRLVNVMSEYISANPTKRRVRNVFKYAELAWREEVNNINEKGKITLSPSRFAEFINSNPQLGVRFEIQKKDNN
jgi:hypothetical protein